MTRQGTVVEIDGAVGARLGDRDGEIRDAHLMMVAEMVVIVKRAEDASNASSASEAREAKIARWRRPSKGEILRGSLSGTLDIDATKAD